MAKGNTEEIKRASRHLRGSLGEALEAPTSHFDPDDVQLIKFHGSYQQDNRDTRKARLAQGQEEEYIFMVRSKIPGGALTAAQYLAHDKICGELGNGTLRITSRQGFQTHGVIKGNLREVIRRINESGATTWGACGDVVRNVICSPVPLKDEPHRAILQLARDLAQTFGAKSHAYSEIWLNGEKISPEQEEEPIYGDVYLPRKFKIAIAIPPRNDIDIGANDLGLAAHVENGKITAYTVYVGGGFGMTHNKPNTFPFLGVPMFTVPAERAIDACIAVITTQRDHGDRTDRKHARIKYLIADRGLPWLRQETESRLDFKPEDPRPVHWSTVQDMLGWHEQGDGKLFCGVWIQEGRIQDTQHERYRTAFRLIAEKFGFPIRLTANVNLYFYDVDPSQRAEVEAILAEHGIAPVEKLTAAKQTAMACVALPTCGLALGESERVFPQILEEIEKVLYELGLEKEEILFRMTGCPNGCARPYNADFGFVGRAPAKYAVYIGGSHRGDRMAGLVHKTVSQEDLPAIVRSWLEKYVGSRQSGESFTDWWGRTQKPGEAPTPAQFHVEFAERAKRLAGKAAVAE